MEREKPQQKNYWDREYNSPEDRYYTQVHVVRREVKKSFSQFIKNKKQEGEPTPLSGGEFGYESPSGSILWKDNAADKLIRVKLEFSKGEFVSDLIIQGTTYKWQKDLYPDGSYSLSQFSKDGENHLIDISNGFPLKTKGEIFNALTNSYNEIKNIREIDLDEDYYTYYPLGWKPPTLENLIEDISKDKDK